jgi:hypothetical protein
MQARSASKGPARAARPAWHGPAACPRRLIPKNLRFDGFSSADGTLNRCPSSFPLLPSGIDMPGAASLDGGGVVLSAN